MIVDLLRERYCLVTFGWDHWTYLRQPAELIDRLLKVAAVVQSVENEKPAS